MKIITLSVTNMQCEHCERKIKSALESLGKFRNISVDYKNKIVVFYSDRTEDTQMALEKIEELGYIPTLSKITEI
jgi:copper chaperone CopZ